MMKRGFLILVALMLTLLTSFGQTSDFRADIQNIVNPVSPTTIRATLDALYFTMVAPDSTTLANTYSATNGFWAIADNALFIANGTNWVRQSPPSGGGATSMNELSDVSSATATVNQLLALNASDVWIPVFITSANVTDKSLAATDLADESLTSLQIAAGAVGTSELAANAIDSTKIATGAVTTTDILDGTIEAVDLAAGVAGNDFDVTSTATAINMTVDDTDYDDGTSILHILTAQASGITIDFNTIPTARIGQQVQIRNNGTSGTITLAAGTASILGDTDPLEVGEFRTGVYTHTNLVFWDAGNGGAGGGSGGTTFLAQATSTLTIDEGDFNAGTDKLVIRHDASGVGTYTIDDVPTGSLGWEVYIHNYGTNILSITGGTATVSGSFATAENNLPPGASGRITWHTTNAAVFDRMNDLGTWNQTYVNSSITIDDNDFSQYGDIHTWNVETIQTAGSTWTFDVFDIADWPASQLPRIVMYNNGVGSVSLVAGTATFLPGAVTTVAEDAGAVIMYISDTEVWSYTIGQTPDPANLPWEYETATTRSLDENDFGAGLSGHRIEAKPASSATYTFDTVTSTELGYWFEIWNASANDITLSPGTSMNIIGPTTIPGEDNLIMYGTYVATDSILVKVEGRTEVMLEYAIGDETTAATTGTAKVTDRAPWAFTVTDVRLSWTTAGTGGVTTIDINEGGTSILSTKLTTDTTEKTSTTAATAAVISDTDIADDAEITIDIDTVNGSPAGGKVRIYGYR